VTCDKDTPRPRTFDVGREYFLVMERNRVDELFRLRVVRETKTLRWVDGLPGDWWLGRRDSKGHRGINKEKEGWFWEMWSDTAAGAWEVRVRECEKRVDESVRSVREELAAIESALQSRKELLAACLSDSPPRREDFALKGDQGSRYVDWIDYHLEEITDARKEGRLASRHAALHLAAAKVLAEEEAERARDA
jgi:hypothetical protein